MQQPRIAVVGLGYVGLPLALAFARKFPETVGFDINTRKVEAIKKGVDVLGEGIDAELRESTLQVTSNPGDLRRCNFFIVGVPTPIDQNRNPDLTPVISACEIVGQALSPGAIVCFESTVYPGVTEEICGPKLEEVSGLRQGIDFKLAYSPERINPGDKEHTLEKIIKVVSGEDAETLETAAHIYGAVIDAGIHRAPSIKVAEAAKVIENSQRELNIAFMNELAIIFDRMNIRTKDVLDAAGTKWNFMRFTPGLVGGHCIGVDPYYLTTKAEQLGYHPHVILAGRRINDGMGQFVAQRAIKLMVNSGIPVKGARVAVLGLSFKENVVDIRNSRVPDIISELREFGATPVVHDPLADAGDVQHEYGIELASFADLKNADVVIYAVPHRQFREMPAADLFGLVKKGGIFVDIKSELANTPAPESIKYWSL